VSHTTAAAEKVYPAELKAILDRAGAGDRSVLPELNRAFDEHPELVPLLGDLHEHAVQAMLAAAAGNCLSAREAIRRQLEGLRNRLRTAASGELEKLLVDRVCLSWLAVHHADVDLAHHLLTNPGGAPAARAAQHRLDGAHRRFLAATRALAAVQKLLARGPSPLDLLGRPVAETVAAEPGRGRSCAVADGVPVLN
jgi:hypothetical protein